MKKFRFIVSLIQDKNDYQLEQAAAAEEAAQRLGVEVKIIYADNDAITQSQQLLQVVQASGEKPDGIVVHPAGTGLTQVATAAVKAGIGWAVLNRDVDYLGQLRRSYRVPAFSVGVDQEEVGRIQGRQMGALIPQGGIALYILGPSTTPVSNQRLNGMQATKPANVQIRTLRGRWTEESGYEAVRLGCGCRRRTRRRLRWWLRRTTTWRWARARRSTKRRRARRGKDGRADSTRGATQCGRRDRRGYGRGCWPLR